MRVTATTADPPDTGADTIIVGLFEGKDVSHDTSDGALQKLVDSGEAKRSFKSLAVAHADERRWVLVGLGKRDDLTAERARVASAVAVGRARELSAKKLCWEVPHKVGEDVVGALVEGAVLGLYRFDAFKSSGGNDDGEGGVSELVVSAHHDVSGPVDRAAVVSRFVNLARDLQNTPANHMTPTILAERARAIGGVEVEVEGREQIVGRGMGAFAAVAQGSDEEPALITMTYRGAGGDGSFPLGLVGKAVTFDSGGISIKPGAKMQEMKFDMSGGAAVIAAMGAIAELELPIDVVAVVGATENLPSGRSVKPGDVVTAMNGTTIEVNNTDAEGRLVLGDCLAHAIDLGAERVVDIATLTGAIVIALGSTYAGLVSNDDDWAVQIEQASGASGDLVWRLPLHEEYADAIKGRYGDISNTVESRKAGAITAAEFLRRFVGDTPWAHVDIAGTAWDTGRTYAAKGGNGVGVRLLVELARRLAERPSTTTQS